MNKFITVSVIIVDLLVLLLLAFFFVPIQQVPQDGGSDVAGAGPNLRPAAYGLLRPIQVAPGSGTGTSSSAFSLFSTQAQPGDTNTSLLTVASSTSATTFTLFQVRNNGHIVTGGPTPTLSAGCGSGATVAGNDSRGKIVFGSTPANPCVLKFAAAWGTPPVCFSVSPTALTITVSPATTSVTRIGIGESGSLGQNDEVIYSCEEYR